MTLYDAPYLELKRKLAEIRANLEILRRGRPLPPSAKADWGILLERFARFEQVTAGEIELYELEHGDNEHRLIEEITGCNKWIDLWRGNPVKKLAQSRQRMLDERNELQAKLEAFQQRRRVLQESIDRFYREEAPEWRKVNQRTRQRLVEVAQKLQPAIVAPGSLRISAVEPVATDKSKADGVPQPIFTHAPDYQSIQFNGVSYFATPQQASIIRVLDEGRRSGKPDVSTLQIKQETKCGKISDSFRAGDGRKLWKKLVVPVSRCKGMYRLNVPLPEK